MSQHDYNIANGGGAAVRADINNALLAVLSQNSGATAPTTTKPFMMWYDTANGVIKQRNAADNAWVTGPQVDASGNVGIGTSSPSAKLDVSGKVKVTAIELGASEDFTTNLYYSGGWKYRSTGYGTVIGAASGAITFSNTASSGSADGAATVTERARIDSNGNFTVVNGIIQTTATLDTSVGYQLIKTSATVTAGVNKFVQFLTNAGAASTGFIASNGANNAGFFAGSDKRIKTDIQGVVDGLEKVMLLKPSKFKFKENNEQSHGFIAQELNQVFPECVYKPNDGEGDDLSEGQEPWAVNFDKLIPYLTAAIQEQQTIITSLTDRIAALENANV